MTAPIDPCPKCGRTDGDPSREVVRRVREALEEAETSVNEAIATLRNRMQSALFDVNDESN